MKLFSLLLCAFELTIISTSACAQAQQPAKPRYFHVTHVQKVGVIMGTTYLVEGKAWYEGDKTIIYYSLRCIAYQGNALPEVCPLLSVGNTYSLVPDSDTDKLCFFSAKDLEDAKGKWIPMCYSVVDAREE